MNVLLQVEGYQSKELLLRSKSTEKENLNSKVKKVLGSNRKQVTHLPVL